MNSLVKPRKGRMRLASLFPVYRRGDRGLNRLGSSFKKVGPRRTGARTYTCLPDSEAETPSSNRHSTQCWPEVSAVLRGNGRSSERHHGRVTRASYHSPSLSVPFPICPLFRLS